ncbi:hypothetical protein [Cohnella xylanilytica]|uniref:hypothetical protein n=1 Tax=Cohnella xylanilytica TaxID=557555 RepID=UPI001BB44253|nr:hypothetical protein [Cohnella xylanilytica]
MPKNSAFKAATAAREGTNAEKFGIQSSRAGGRAHQCRKIRHSEQPRWRESAPMPKNSAFGAAALAGEGTNA